MQPHTPNVVQPNDAVDPRKQDGAVQMYKISGECGFKENISETGRWTHEWIINEHNYNRDNFQRFLNMRFLNMPILKTRHYLFWDNVKF